MNQTAESISPGSPLLLTGFSEVAAASLQPEKRLMLALLEGAVGDFQKYTTAFSGRGRRLFAEADAWFRSTATDDPLNFENVCHALGLEPAFIRAGLRRWCSTRREEPRPSRAVLHLCVRRVGGSRHRIVAASCREEARPRAGRGLFDRAIAALTLSRVFAPRAVGIPDPPRNRRRV